MKPDLRKKWVIGVFLALILAAWFFSAGNSETVPDYDSRSMQLFGEGFDLLQAGDANGAVTKFEEGLKSEPGNIDANFYLAEAYLAARKVDAAIQQYKKVVAADVSGTLSGKANMRLETLTTSQKAEPESNAGAAEVHQNPASNASYEVAVKNVQSMAKWPFTEEAHCVFRLSNEPDGAVVSARELISRPDEIKAGGAVIYKCAEEKKCTKALGSTFDNVILSGKNADQVNALADYMSRLVTLCGGQSSAQPVSYAPTTRSGPSYRDTVKFIESLIYQNSFMEIDKCRFKTFEREVNLSELYVNPAKNAYDYSFGRCYQEHNCAGGRCNPVRFYFMDCNNPDKGRKALSHLIRMCNGEVVKEDLFN